MPTYPFFKRWFFCLGEDKLQQRCSRCVFGADGKTGEKRLRGNDEYIRRKNAFVHRCKRKMWHESPRLSFFFAIHPWKRLEFFHNRGNYRVSRTHPMVTGIQTNEWRFRYGYGYGYMQTMGEKSFAFSFVRGVSSIVRSPSGPPSKTPRVYRRRCPEMLCTSAGTQVRRYASNSSPVAFFCPEISTGPLLSGCFLFNLTGNHFLVMEALRAPVILRCFDLRDFFFMFRFCYSFCFYFEVCSSSTDKTKQIYILLRLLRFPKTLLLILWARWNKIYLFFIFFVIFIVLNESGQY